MNTTCWWEEVLSSSSVGPCRWRQEIKWHHIVLYESATLELCVVASTAKLSGLRLDGLAALLSTHVVQNMLHNLFWCNLAHDITQYFHLFLARQNWT